MNEATAGKTAFREQFLEVTKRNTNLGSNLIPVSFDGEAVLLGVDGVSDFDGLHSRRYDDTVQVYAFDILALDGDD